MRRAVLLLILLIASGKYGLDYLLSDEFQAYGDRTKAPWTCYANMYLAESYNLLSKYDRAIFFYTKVLERCPESPIAERCEFERARAYENDGKYQIASDAYEVFAAKYPGGRRARLASKSAGILKTN